ncbi:hypothetical protein [Janthinobacterium agaricidamnosum]|nr:hypothetical protein [Janthinobacterium agaricidamnosum]
MMSHAISPSEMGHVFSAMEAMSKAGVSKDDQKKLLAEARAQGVDPEKIGADLHAGKTVSQLEHGRI